MTGDMYNLFDELAYELVIVHFDHVTKLTTA